MFIVVSFIKYLKVEGIALFPFVIISNKQFSNNSVLINHERIHLRQQVELLIVFFYLWYFIEYLLRRLHSDHQKAYRSITFEREAYSNQDNLSYLKNRSPYAFMFYHNRK